MSDTLIVKRQDDDHAWQGHVQGVRTEYGERIYALSPDQSCYFKDTLPRYLCVGVKESDVLGRKLTIADEIFKEAST